MPSLRWSCCVLQALEAGIRPDGAQHVAFGGRPGLSHGAPLCRQAPRCGRGSRQWANPRDFRGRGWSHRAHLTRFHTFFLASRSSARISWWRKVLRGQPMSQAFAPTTGLAPIDNELVARLLADALALLDQDRNSARRHIERAAAVARGRPLGRPAKGLLADWQVRRAERYIQTNIASPLRIQDVARTVNLSASYFSRAFKATKGVSYTNFVIRARITLAKQLLLTTDTAISDIALACGLADQSPLTRLFSQSEGLPPRAWRRYQLDEAFDRAAAAN